MFGLIRKKNATKTVDAELNRAYEMGQAFGYVDALRDLAIRIRRETRYRNSQNISWTFRAFVEWCENEMSRMAQEKIEEWYKTKHGKEIPLEAISKTITEEHVSHKSDFSTES